MLATRLVRASLFALVVPVAIVTLQTTGAAAPPDRDIPSLHAEPPMLGIHWARGEAGKAKPGGGSTPNLTLHGGNVMSGGVHVEPIFWGPKWATTYFPTDVITGLQGWYEAVGGTPFDGTNTEYAGVDGKFVSTDVVYGGSHTDPSSVPSTVSKLTTPTLNEVCKMIKDPVANGYYPVYTDQRRGTAGFCAYHSWASCNGVNVQFGFFFDLTNDPGCDPQDPSTVHSQPLEALANVTAHELSEAQTDPRGSGWLDKSGAENADKCAWSFSGQPVILSDTTSWKLQGNWSNSAYNHGTGYPNSSGQKACIDGN